MRVSRLSPRQNSIRDYLRQLWRDSGRTVEDKQFLDTQVRRLAQEFEGASAAEQNRLRCALENLEVGRDRSQPWETRGPALDRAARILQSLEVIPRREKGRTIPGKPRQSTDPFITPRLPVRQDPDPDDKDGQDDETPLEAAGGLDEL